MELVRSPAQVREASRLAAEVWQEHYTPIIGAEQVAYMLSRFQSAEAIQRQIDEGHCYYLASMQGVAVGYCAIVPAQDSMKLSKIYVLKAWRRHGIARAMLHTIEEVCLKRGINELWLTVNIHNRLALNWYHQRGFINTGAIVQDIGNGFVMDDYRMVKRLL